jgi:hypothetical protein
MQPYFDPTRKTTSKKNGRGPQKKNEEDLKKKNEDQLKKTKTKNDLNKNSKMKTTSKKMKKKK